MQVDARTLARAEARQDTGHRVGADAAEIVVNIDIVDIHEVLMANAPNRDVAGRVRSKQNWIGGNDYNPCGAGFVPPPPEYVLPLLEDLAGFCNEEMLPPIVQAAVAHAQFETIHPFEDGNGCTGRALIQVVFRRRGLAPAFVPPVSVIATSQG
jgi:Uncharacterized conserved protein